MIYAMMSHASLTESKKAQQELRKAALDAARIQKKVKKGDSCAFLKQKRPN